MRSILTLSLLISSIWLNAQVNVQLSIVHHLNNVEFNLNQEASNNLDEVFSLDRVEYYISDVVLVDAGGVETPVSNHWILVDASELTLDDLGVFDVSEVDRIRFSVGVGPDVNNLDPASYPSDHPLAPQFPSMHWGWAAGYRFVAMEGNSGEMMSQLFQVHALGNANYFETEVDVTSEMVGSDLVVEIYANYAKAIEDISVEAGMIVHGDYGEAITLLQNFRDYVFSGSEVVSPPISTGIDLTSGFEISLYPNPTLNNSIQIDLGSNQMEDLTLEIYDMTGRLLDDQTLLSGSSSFNVMLPEGAASTYLILISSNGEVLHRNQVFRF
jgi:hypothetical protein